MGRTCVKLSVRQSSTCLCQLTLHISKSRLAQDLQPEYDGCSENDCRPEYFRATVVASCQTSLDHQTAKHDLNRVASFVATLVVLDNFAPRLPAKDTTAFSCPRTWTKRSLLTRKSNALTGGRLKSVPGENRKLCLESSAYLWVRPNKGTQCDMAFVV